jgi:hypothetical protein
MDHSTHIDHRLLFWAVFLANMSGGMIISLPQAALPLLATHTHVPLDIAGAIFTGTSLGTRDSPGRTTQ